MTVMLSDETDENIERVRQMMIEEFKDVMLTSLIQIQPTQSAEHNISVTLNR